MNERDLTPSVTGKEGTTNSDSVEKAKHKTREVTQKINEMVSGVQRVQTRDRANLYETQKASYKFSDGNNNGDIKVVNVMRQEIYQWETDVVHTVEIEGMGQRLVVTNNDGTIETEKPNTRNSRDIPSGMNARISPDSKPADLSELNFYEGILERLSQPDVVRITDVRG